ncbi:MAG: hypothetical protein ACK2UO_00420 [Caldilineaceae bacterium]
MARIVFGIFLVLHGFVHLLYAGQSLRLFELQAGLVWPDGSWALSDILDNGTTRQLAAVLLVITAAGFLLGGTAVLLNQAWWRYAVVAAAAFSTLLYIALWDVTWRQLDAKGAVGILINLGIVVVAIFWGVA